MNKLKQIAAAMFAVVASMAACGQPTLRILPLGDSITVGTGSLETGGYRGPLWAKLTSAGYAVEFVGTQTTSPTGAYAAMSKAHEGHGGARITNPNGDRLGVLDCLPAWMAKVETPDVVLLHLGTNDSDESDFGEQGVLDMEKTLELIRAIAPKAHVVLSTLMWRENATCYANIQAFNARLAGLVTLQRKRGQKISLVDMHTLVPGGDANFADGLHPNATGYGLMADVWLTSIETIYPDPQTLVEAAVDVVPSTDAYIESHGNRSVNLGYYMTTKSRIEVDFRYPSMPVKSGVLFGPFDAAAKLSTIFWNDAGGAYFGWSYGDNGHHGITMNGANGTAAFPYDTNRHTAIIDVFHNEVRVEQDGRTAWKMNPTFSHANDAEWPIVLFGATKDANGNGFQEVGRVRIYAVRVYDNDKIEHEWVASAVNGVPMLVDKCGGPSLYHQDSLTTNPNSPFKAGGAIASDAYVESDGTQVLNTGYYATPKSRFEVDFQLLDLSYDSVFYGSWASGSASNLRFCGWNFSGGGKKMQNILGGQNTSPQHVLGTLDSGRHTSILDIKNQMCYLTTGAVTNYSKATTGANVQPGDKGEYPMGVFANMGADSKPGMPSKSRVFEVRIYENEKLVHDFLPYKNGDEVGMRDVLTGALALKTTQGSVPKIGGCGFGPDHAAFFEEPVGGIVPTDGRTLSAFAPGAIGYQWYKDGEAIPGAVLGTLKLDWQKGAKPATYAVKAIFDNFGTRVEKTSRSVDVEMEKLGFKIIIR